MKKFMLFSGLFLCSTSWAMEVFYATPEAYTDSDFYLVIDTQEKAVIKVSSFIISKSKSFDDTKKLGKNFYFELSENNKMALINSIYVLHKQELNNLETTKVLDMALFNKDYLKNNKIEKLSLKILKKHISEKSPHELLTILAQISNEKISKIENDHTLNEAFLKPIAVILSATYQSIDDIENKYVEFLNLPQFAVLNILQKKEFKIDSENSLLHYVVLWVLHDTKNRDKCLAKLLLNVKFFYLSPYYRLEMVKNLPQLINNEEANRTFVELSDLAQKTRIGGLKRMQLLGYFSELTYDNQLGDRPKIKDDNKVVFSTMGQYFRNGYDFSCFTNSTDQDSFFKIYLSVKSKLLSKYFLPLQISCSIKTLDNKDKMIAPLKIIFQQDNDRATISLGELSVADLKVEIIFLDSAEDCIEFSKDLHFNIN